MSRSIAEDQTAKLIAQLLSFDRIGSGAELLSELHEAASLLEFVDAAQAAIHFRYSHTEQQWAEAMSTTKTVSISLPSAQLRKAESTARRENRTISQLVREALRRYEEEIVATKAARAALAKAVENVQKNAARKGRNRLSARQIEREIAAVRKARARKAPAAASA